MDIYIKHLHKYGSLFKYNPQSFDDDIIKFLRTFLARGRIDEKTVSIMLQLPKKCVICMTTIKVVNSNNDDNISICAKKLARRAFVICKKCTNCDVGIHMHIECTKCVNVLLFNNKIIKCPSHSSTKMESRWAYQSVSGTISPIFLTDDKICEVEYRNINLHNVTYDRPFLDNKHILKPPIIAETMINSIHIIKKRYNYQSIIMFIMAQNDNYVPNVLITDILYNIVFYL